MLVNATDLRVWREDETTRRIMAYLAAWRGQLLEHMGEGGTLFPSNEASALKTTEAVAKAQLLKDILALKPADIAAFYGIKVAPEKPDAAK